MRIVFQFYVIVCFIGISTLCFAETHDPKSSNPIPVSEEDMPVWRHWDETNGLTYNRVDNVSVDYFGNLLFMSNEELFIYDGYSFQSHPSPKKNRMVNQNRNGQLWAQDAKGFLLYSNNEWMLHDVGKSVEFSETYTRNVVSFIQDEFYLSNEEELILYNPSTQTQQTLLLAEDTPLKKIEEISNASNNTIWITGYNSLARIHLPTSAWTDDAVIEYIPFPEPYRDYEPLITYCYSNQEIVLVLKSEDPFHRVLLHYTNGEWDVVFEGRFSTGWLCGDDGYWIIRISDDLSRFSHYYYSGDQFYEM